LAYNKIGPVNSDQRNITIHILITSDHLISITMKQSIKSLVILLVLITSSVIAPKLASAQQDDVNFQVFYDELSPYGQWVDYQNYGYAWIPDAGSGFVPYSTDGHWVLSDYGWTWVSDYEWGWAPFHYGRWDYDNYYGWLWIPDNQWGPAWVNWRQSDGYYGWSPMEPGISLSIGFGRAYSSSNDHWMFVRDRDFERPDIDRYYVNRTDHARIVRNSTVIRSTYIDNSRHTTYVTGPARNDVQRVTGRQIKPVSIRENTRPGQQRLNNGQLEMYRPQVNNNNRERKAAPSRITNLKDVKRPSERSGANQQRNASPANNSERQQQPQQQRQQQQRTAPASNNGRQQQQQREQQQGQQQRQQDAQQQRQQQQGQQRQQQQDAQQQRQQQQRQATPANNNAQQQQRQQQQGQQRQQQQDAQQQQRQQQQQQQNAQQQQQQRQAQQQQQRQAQPQQQQRQQQPAQQQQRQQQPAQQQQQRQQQPAQQQRSATPANGGERQQQPREAKQEKEKKRND